MAGTFITNKNVLFFTIKIFSAGCGGPCATYIKSSEPKRAGSLPEAPRVCSPSEPRRHSCPLPETLDVGAPPCLETRPYKGCPSGGGVAGKSRKSEGGDIGGGAKGHADGKPMAQKLLGILYKIREPLAEHQAAQGLPKDE